MRPVTRSTSASRVASICGVRARRAARARDWAPDRAPPHARPHPSRVTVVRERVQLAARRPAERSRSASPRPAARPGRRWSIADCAQLLRGHLHRPPRALDRQRKKEVQLSVGGTTQQPVGLGGWAGDLREELGPGDPTEIARPTSRQHSRYEAGMAISLGGPRRPARRPPTSRNASSMEMPSTSGVVSAKMPKTARLASEYASNRGRTTIASGHSRNACRPPMAFCTPRRFAS